MAETQNVGESKLYQILASAAISETPYHAAYLIQDDGLFVGGKIYDRRAEVVNPCYTILEVQGDNEGPTGALHQFATTKEDAESKLFTVLAAAAISNLPYHAGYLIEDDGMVNLWKVYDRRITEEAVIE